jgi:cell division protein FtsB
VQHINLVSQLGRTNTPLFAAIHQFWLVVAVIVIMSCVGITAWIGNQSGADELAVLKAQQQESSSQLDRLNAKIIKLKNVSSLKSQIELTQEDIVFRRKLLASVGPVNETITNFAEHLTGLARQHVDGMWFTTIQLQDGGHQLALRGRTQHAELLPRYLQKLRSEKIFSGHNFKVFRMKVPEDRVDLLDFELRAGDMVTSDE